MDGNVCLFPSLRARYQLGKMRGVMPLGIVSSRWQWAALSLWFLVLKECHAQELLNMGIQTGVMRTSAL